MRNRDNSANVSIRAQVDRLGRPDIAVLNREIARFERMEACRRLLYSALAVLLSAAAAAVLLTNLWLPVLQISDFGMNPLLKMNGLVLFVQTDSPDKNDVIAFYVNNSLHVRRVIALPGDWVSIGGDGTVAVNGAALDEPYVAEAALGICDIEFPFRVPAGTYFVLSDNRSASSDSRDSRFGTVGREQIIGKAVLGLWPLRQI